MIEHEQLKQALAHSQTAVYLWNTEDDTLKWEGNTTLFFGDIDLPPQTVDKFHTLIDDKYKMIVDEVVSRAKASKEPYRLQYSISIGGARVVRVVEWACPVDDSDGKIYIGTLHLYDREQLHSEEFTPDSEFFNREFFEALKALYDSDDVNDYMLLKLSVDNLPMMMTWYAADFAERIMAALEVELLQLLGERDIMMRLSLDQFGVLIKRPEREDVERLVNEMLKTVQLYRNPSFDEAIHLRMSVGSVCLKDAVSVEDALNKSYLALSTVKGEAADFYCDYEDAKREHLDSREQITKLHQIQKAVRDDRMKIAYQPLVEAKSGNVSSYECLLRMVDGKTGDLISAAGFIDVAEKLGSIDLVDDYVMRKVVQEVKDYPDITLALNVSNVTTDNATWLKAFSKLVQDESVARRITIEITETAAQRDMRQTAYFVAAVQALGCRVALDDFGAGYTSFRQLKTLSVDIVKIDGSYVRELSPSSENLLFIKTLLDFNKNYGLKTVAECVENGEIAKLLIDVGVDHLQGYYFGRPDINRPWAGERDAF